MKALLLILALAVSSFAQSEPDWKLIKEMSGDIPNNPGLTVETYATRIARGDHKTRLIVRADFPGGAPVNVFRDNVPRGFDVSSISRITFKVELNCETLVLKPVNGSAEVFQFNGRRLKSKEVPFKLDSGHIFAEYFCEQPSTKPTGPPTLKP